MTKNEKINVKGTEITLFSHQKEDYISLTDMAKYRDNENPSQVISLWLRTYSTIEYLGLWEMLNNPDFKPHIYEGFKNESAKPDFFLVFSFFLWYIGNMAITQTVEIPANRRITVEVPREIRTETVILTFTPPQTVLCNEVSRAKKRKFTEEEEIEYINRHADRLNAEAMDVFSYQVPLWDDEK